MKKQILNEEFRRMQLLAGVITENKYKEELKENTTQDLDLDLLKDLQNDPTTKKLRQQFISNPQLALKAAKFVADAVDGKIDLNEERYTSGPNQGHEIPTTKEKIKGVLTSAGLGTIASFILTMSAAAQAIPPTGDLGALPIILASIIGGSLIGTGIGAIATMGFKRKLEEDDENIEDQLSQIIAIGRKA